MEIDAPTFNSLNKPQRRALILRDELRYLEARHLDTFIEGLTNPEPPTYKRINGTVYPALTMVKLKDVATRFDLGNVHFDNDASLGTGVFRAYLTVEDGRFELRTDDPLPQDDANMSCVPIHVFIAKGMVQMFETKFKAIWARKNQINEIRQVAFNMCSQQPVDEFQEGETLARLDANRSAPGTPGQAKKKKRRPGEPVPKHASNMRKRVGLDTIPESAKTATFNTIPDAIKVDLFNNVVKTAFPNFDNLMMASWNVVSVYSNVGTDFPELHKAVVELKHVLQDFEEGFGGKVVRSDPKVRRDFVPPEQSGTDREPGTPGPRSAPDSSQNGGGDASSTPRSDAAITPQQQDDIDSLFNEPEAATAIEPALPEPEHEPDQPMPPPRPLQIAKRPPFADADSDEEEGRSHMPTKPNRRSTSILARSTPEQRRSREPSATIEPRPLPPLPTPALKRPLSAQSLPTTLAPSTKKARTASAKPSAFTPSDSNDDEKDKGNDNDKHRKQSLADTSPAALRAAYNDRKRRLLATFGGNANVPQQYRVQMQKMMAEIKAREQEAAVARRGERGEREGDGGDGGRDDGGQARMSTSFLGNSVLGGKKMAGVAGGGGAGGNRVPVAPMVPGSGSSSSSVRRERERDGDGDGKRRL